MARTAAPTKRAKVLVRRSTALKRLIDHRRRRETALARSLVTNSAVKDPSDEKAWIIPAAKSCSSTEELDALIQWNCLSSPAAKRLRVYWRSEFVAQIGSAALAAVLDSH